MPLPEHEPAVMRDIHEHQVNPANDLLTIKALDEHPSGVPHHYVVYPPNGVVTHINFQNGPILEHGVNGLTQEALLVVVLDRLRGFQKGQYACRENALAITKIEEGLLWLHKRTLDRMHRGVEGTRNK